MTNAGVELEPLYSSACILVACVWMTLSNIWTIGAVIVKGGILLQAEMVIGKKLYLHASDLGEHQSKARGLFLHTYQNKYQHPRYDVTVTS